MLDLLDDVVEDSSPKIKVSADIVEHKDGGDLLLDLLGCPLLRAISLRKVTLGDLPFSVRPLDERR